MSEVANSYGAVDLSSQVRQTPGTGGAPVGGNAPVAQPAGGAAGGPVASVPGPLIVDVTEATFEEQMALSLTVPVVFIIYSAKSLSSQQALSALEDSARRFAGAFEVGRIDADTQPNLAAAFQLQTLPTAVAIVAKRPVPLFEGAPSAEQVDGLINELLAASAQLGVTGRIEVGEEQLEKPMPEAHVAPREAEANDDWPLAIKLWKKVLANNPTDKEAKLALARAQFEARQVDTLVADNTLAEADREFREGREAEAYALLLQAIAQAPSEEERESARTRLVELFTLGMDPEAVKTARRRLSTMLLV